MLEYKLIVESNFETLEQQVNLYLKSGWHTNGGIVISSYNLIQPIIRSIPPEGLIPEDLFPNVKSDGDMMGNIININDTIVNITLEIIKYKRDTFGTSFKEIAEGLGISERSIYRIKTKHNIN